MEKHPEEIFAEAERLYTAGMLGEAAFLFLQLADVAPWVAEANNRLGVIAGLQGRMDASREYLEKAVAAAPGRIDIRQNLLLTLERLDMADLALELLLDIGAIQYIGKDYAGAIDSFSRGLAFRPGWPRAWVNLAAAFEANGQYGRSLNVALPHLINSAEGFSDQIALLHDFVETFAGEFPSEAFPQRLAFQPDNQNRASAFNTIGSLARHRGATDLARRAYEMAIRLYPEIPVFHQNLGQVQLSSADFKQGWDNYEARIGVFESVPSRELDRLIWRDQPLENKTLLLWAEQGFGDTVQMLRFIPAIAARAGHIILEVQVELVRLAANICDAPNVEVVPRILLKDRVLGDRDFDFHCPLMSLPQRLDLGIDNLSGKPYFRVTDTDRLRWRGWLRESGQPATALRVGLAWAGRPTHSRDHVRSVSLRQLAPLFRLPDIRWVSLQVGPGRDQLAGLPSGIDVLDLTDCLRDFGETAALVSQLDAVVSVDTAVVHVAGALGIPTAVILPSVPDWRWMFGRSDSPWYDSLTLFRRENDHDVSGALLDRIGRWLTARLDSGSNQKREVLK